MKKLHSMLAVLLLITGAPLWAQIIIGDPPPGGSNDRPDPVTRAEQQELQKMREQFLKHVNDDWATCSTRPNPHFASLAAFLDYLKVSHMLGEITQIPSLNPTNGQKDTCSAVGDGALLACLCDKQFGYSAKTCSAILKIPLKENNSQFEDPSYILKKEALPK